MLHPRVPSQLDDLTTDPCIKINPVQIIFSEFGKGKNRPPVFFSLHSGIFVNVQVGIGVVIKKVHTA